VPGLRVVPESALLEALGAIIEKSRAITGHAPLRDSQLEAAVVAWAEILEDLPPEELEMCYRAVMRDRKLRTAVQPQELLEVWRTRSRARGAPPVPLEATERCGLCDSTGYQLLEIYCPTLQWNYRAARSCNCSFTPTAQRREPRKPPEWLKGKDSVWRAQFGPGLPCHCRNCQEQRI
jgi:hypothetical protein